MAHKVYIGIDNGTTGTIGIVGEVVHPTILLTPVRVEQSYTKKKQNMTRIDHFELKKWLIAFMEGHDMSEGMVIMERPMTNSMFGGAVISSARAFESTRIIVEQLQLPHIFVDSRQWQKVMLPAGTKGSAELKKASMDIGLRLFPDQEAVIRKHKDADGLLIAEWARREGL